MRQIYLFIHDFIDTTYSTSKGPLFLRNLTDINNGVSMRRRSSRASGLSSISQIKRVVGHFSIVKVLDGLDVLDPFGQRIGNGVKRYVGLLHIVATGASCQGSLL